MTAQTTQYALTREAFASDADYENYCAEITRAAASVQPELTVWVGMLPESNGKSNFTALLKRKDAGPFDTNYLTIAMSEYPDRVRYEADCVRFLIGEIKEDPCILDYDTDKHSDYVEPASQKNDEALNPALVDAADKLRQASQDVKDLQSKAPGSAKHIDAAHKYQQALANLTDVALAGSTQQPDKAEISAREVLKDQKAKFEAWAVTAGLKLDLAVYRSGGYKSLNTVCAWNAWKDGREELVRYMVEKDILRVSDAEAMS